MAEKKNPEYDFKWCPGCGDFGVKKALEAAIKKKTIETEEPISVSYTHLTLPTKA